MQEQSQPNQARDKSECIYLNISWGSLPFFARRFEGLRLAAVDVAEAILLSQVSDQQNLQGWRVAGGLECRSSLTSKQAHGPYSAPPRCKALPLTCPLRCNAPAASPASAATALPRYSGLSLAPASSGTCCQCCSSVPNAFSTRSVRICPGAMETAAAP